MNSNANELSRRTLLGVAGAAGAGAILAGCMGQSEYDETLYEDEDLVEEEPDYSGYLDDVNYPGMVDWTGESEVTVLVGSGSQGTNFGPAAIRIDRGTTVVWEWTGDGGGHDVVDTDGTFESDQTTSSDHTFEHTFEDTGVYTYACLPHETQGMKGAVEVV